MKDTKKVVVFITKWYPNREDPQLGVFIQKQALSIQNFCKVYVLSVDSKHQGEKDQIYMYTNQNITEIRYSYQSSRIKTYRFIQNLNAWESMIQEVEKRESKIDLIHAHILLRPAWIAMRAATKRKIPYFISEHWTGFATGIYNSKNPFYKRISQWVCKNASAVAVVSEQLKKSMISSGLQANYCIIPNVIEGTVSDKSKDPGEKIKILTIADLYDANKNISGSIRAIERISKKRDDFEFHVIGGGPDENELIALSNVLQLTNRYVFFHGRLPNNEVLQRIQQYDFLLVNSRIETFSVSAAEALACGKPVVTSICGGPESFVDESNGILFTVDDPGALQNSIEQMLDSYHTFDPVTISTEIKNKFSKEMIAKLLLNMYQSDSNV